MFHQLEGPGWSTRAIHMGHLKGTLIEFCRAFFDIDDLPVQVPAQLLPLHRALAPRWTSAAPARAAQLKIGHGDDWLEILGCGMVHPKVLENGGIDPTRYQGFAFGMGVERIAMLKYGIPDLRTFFESDLRWLRHYGFVPLEAPSLVRGL